MSVGPGPLPPGAAAPTRLRHQLRRLAQAPARLHLRLATAAYLFRRAQGARHLGYASLADYCNGVLKVPTSTFRDWAHAGELLLQAPALRHDLVAGRLRPSVLSLLARSCSAQEALRWAPHLHGLPVRRVRELLRQPTEVEAASRADGCASSDGCAPPAGDVSSRGSELSASAPSAGPAAAPAPVPSPASVASAAVDDKRFITISLQVPTPVHRYVDDTLHVAHALLGQDAPQDLAWEAILAEASSDLACTVTVSAACRRFRIDPRKLEEDDATTSPARDISPHSSEALAAAPAPHAAVPAASPKAGSPGLPLLPLPAVTRPRRVALVLHRALPRLLAKERSLTTELEDQLLALHMEDAHTAFGYASFQDLAGAECGLAPSSLWDKIANARRRRRDDPLACALAGGLIGTVQANLLERLRRLHVPPSALPAWIDTAHRVTVRRLRTMLAWARLQVIQDNRSWSLAGFPPPDERQLRTSAPDLDHLAAHPEPPALRSVATAPTQPLRLTLSTENLASLLQGLASLQDQETQRRRMELESHDRSLQAGREAGPASNPGDGMPHSEETSPPGDALYLRPPVWWALLRLCLLARKAWADHAKPHPHRFRAILARDGWRCAVPDCTQRQTLEVHHIRFQSQGGGNDADNLITLCAFHHRYGVHDGHLRIRGKATRGGDSLTWELGKDDEGRPLQVFVGDTHIEAVEAVRQRARRSGTPEAGPPRRRRDEPALV